MVTAGADRKLKVWDLRNYKEQQMYMLNKPVDVVDISQLGVLATGFGPHVHVWRDYTTTKAQKPYMTHDLSMGGRIFDLHFTPFDDTLGIGHMKVRRSRLTRVISLTTVAMMTRANQVSLDSGSNLTFVPRDSHKFSCLVPASPTSTPSRPIRSRLRNNVVRARWSNCWRRSSPA